MRAVLDRWAGDEGIRRFQVMVRSAVEGNKLLQRFAGQPFGPLGPSDARQGPNVRPLERP